MSTIKIDSVLMPTYSHRKHSPEETHIIELADSLSEKGQDNAIKVLDNGDGTYTLNDGHRRFTAGELLFEKEVAINGLEVGEITATIVGMTADYTEEQQLLLQMEGNVHTLASTSADFANSCYILGRAGMKPEDIAKKLNVGKTKVYSWIKTMALPDDVRELVRGGEISLGNVPKLTEIKNKVDETDFEDLVEKAQTLSIADFGTLVDEKIAEIKEEAKKAREEAGATEVAEPVFEAKPVVKSKAEILELYAIAVTDFEASPTEANEGRVVALKAVVSLTAEDVETQRAEWDEKQEKKATAKAEKEKKAILDRQAKDAERLKELTA